jgi:hypothetical protein
VAVSSLSFGKTTDAWLPAFYETTLEDGDLFSGEFAWNAGFSLYYYPSDKKTSRLLSTAAMMRYKILRAVPYPAAVKTALFPVKLCRKN